jgi:hypothetical protein
MEPRVKARDAIEEMVHRETRAWDHQDTAALVGLGLLGVDAIHDRALAQSKLGVDQGLHHEVAPDVQSIGIMATSLRRFGHHESSGPPRVMVLG